MPLLFAAEARWHAGSIAEEKAARRDVVNMVTAACGLAGHRHSQRWRRQHQTAAEAAPARCHSPVTFGESKAAPAPCASEISLSAGSTRLVESLPRKGREHRKSGPPQTSECLAMFRKLPWLWVWCRTYGTRGDRRGSLRTFRRSKDDLKRPRGWRGALVEARMPPGPLSDSLHTY